jgi:hypothetical protein
VVGRCVYEYVERRSLAGVSMDAVSPTDRDD